MRWNIVPIQSVYTIIWLLIGCSTFSISEASFCSHQPPFQRLPFSGGRVSTKDLSRTKESKNANSKVILKSTPVATTSEASDAQNIQRLITNLFSVCAHIQNPDLYSPTWADNAVLKQVEGTGDPKLVASRDIERGEILSLYPIHALGLRTPKIKSKKPAKKNSKKLNIQKNIHRDFVVFDRDRDGPYFQGQIALSMKRSQPIHSNYKLNFPLHLIKEDEPVQREIFVDVNPKRDLPMPPGWLGHMASEEGEESTPNCLALPLPGASPLCALVAVNDIVEGSELISFSSSAVADEEILRPFASLVKKQYVSNIEELRAYLDMAYQDPLQPAMFDAGQTDEAASANEKITFDFSFRKINLDYPGLRYLHRDPDILAIENFLTDAECDEIVDNAGPHLIPCVIKHPTTGEVIEDPSRTSTNANLPQSDIPSIVGKLVKLLNCEDATYVETLQILKYTRGQSFQPHTDGFRGPTSACGFEESGRMVTVFCYLNDVPEGGGTRFTQLSNLTISPRKGMVVVHFPTTTGFEEDPRTEHEGTVAIDDKWLLVTWMWKHPRKDPQYDDSLLSSIMSTPKEKK